MELKMSFITQVTASLILQNFQNKWLFLDLDQLVVNLGKDLQEFVWVSKPKGMCRVCA